MFTIPVFIYLYRFCKTFVFSHRATYRASTGPRPGLDWAPTGPRASHAWRAMDQMNIIQKTYKLAKYQNSRCKVRGSSSEDVISEDMSPKT